MKKRLLPYCVLLILCFIGVKTHASTETSDHDSVSPYVLTDKSDLPTNQMQLKGTDVEVNINGSIAEVTVRQQFKNMDNQIITGRYVFPAPTKALVHGIQMKTDEKTFTATVKEQKTAREDFNRFKEEGKNVLLLKQERKDLYSMNLANIMPGETVDIELSYTELLIPTNMEYEFVYPAVSAPGYTAQPEADFNIEVNISSGIPIRQVMSMTHDIDTILETESSAKVVLKDSDKNGPVQDYILRYRLAAQKMPSGLILSAGKDEKFLLLNEYIGAPGLKNISVRFTDLKTYDLEPSSIPDISDHRPVTVLAKWEGDADGLIKVEGRMNRRDYSKTYRFVKNKSRNANGALKHLWAEKRLERLSGLETQKEYPDINSEITDLGLKYNVLTKNTSFLALNDTVRKMVTPVVEVEQSLPLPEEEEMPAPARIAKVPEPEFYLLVLIMTAVLATGSVRRKAAFKKILQ